MVKLFFGRKWWWTTLLVIAAIGVTTRLGFWQLDRLAQRRVFNAEVSSRLRAAPLTFADLSGLQDLTGLKYRSVIVRGQYDHSQEIALNNQTWQGQPGVHLITPLIVEGSDRAVLVDRGWIPYAESAPEKWPLREFAEPGPVQVTGWILLSDERPSSNNVLSTSASARELTWFRVDIHRLQAQVSHPLLPIYIQQSPTLDRAGLPYRSGLNLDLSEGPHLGYAIFWFSFAAMLGIGYVRYVRHQSLPTLAPASGTLSESRLAADPSPKGSFGVG